MKRDLDQLFDHCISQLNSGVDVETILESYPEEAAELRLLLRTVALIREVPQPTASPKARARGKRRLLRAVAAKKRALREAEATETSSAVRRVLDRAAAWLQPLLQPQARPERSEWGPMRRLAMTVATLLVVITMTGWGVTLTAANSLPDSPLYPVKLASEQIRLTLTTSSTGKAQIQLSRAERRFDEVQTLIETGRGADENALRAAQEQSRVAWDAITRTPEETRQLLVSDFGSWAQERQAALEEVKPQLPPEQQVVVDRAIESLSIDIELAEKALRWPPTPSPATDTPTTAPPTATKTRVPTETWVPTKTRVATKTATRTSTPKPTRAPATATVPPTPVPPTATPTVEIFPELVQPDLKPTKMATFTPAATATPKEVAATPTPAVTVTATPLVVPPTATPTEHSEITVPPIQSTPLQLLPTPTPVPPTATPTPEEPSQVGQPPVPAATVFSLPTPTP